MMLPAGAPAVPGVMTTPVYATFWPRVAASIIDWVLLAAVGWVIDLVVPTLAQSLLPEQVDESSSVSALMVVGLVSLFTAWASVPGLVGAAYAIYFNGQGATLGKKAMGLRVVDAEGNPPGLRRGAIRYSIEFGGWVLSLLVSGALWIGWLAGGLDAALAVGAISIVVLFAYTLFTIYDVLSMIWHDRKQTIHDRLAGTFVVREQSVH